MLFRLYKRVIQYKLERNKSKLILEGGGLTLKATELTATEGFDWNYTQKSLRLLWEKDDNFDMCTVSVAAESNISYRDYPTPPSNKEDKVNKKIIEECISTMVLFLQPRLR